MLDRNALLRPAAALEVRVEDAHMRVFVDGAPVDVAEYTLRVLEALSQPRTLAQVVDMLAGQAASPQQWMTLTGEVRRLIASGVLVQQTTETLRPRPENRMQPGEARLHLTLLRDMVRSKTYIEALRSVIQPGDVVIDIGTGNGILAMAAARAGASRVYAVEGGPVAATTRRIFEANGLADRITLLEGWSSAVNVPEKADVIVSEVLSNDIFTENHLQTTRDALRRMLKPGGRILPHAARIYGRLVQVDDAHRQTQSITLEDIEHWRTVYGMDFSPLYEEQWHGQMRMRVRGEEFLAQHPPMSDATLIGAVSLDVIDSLSYRASAEFVVARDGRVDGLIGHFDLDVTPEHHLTTDPLAEPHAESWFHEIWLCEPIAARAGDRLKVTLTHEYRHPLSVAVAIEPA
jgi:protein arginine N-methyltransferase 1